MTQGMPMTPAQREARNAGPLMSGWEISQAIVRCLALRLPPWLDEAARQQGAPVKVKHPLAVVVRDNVSNATKGKFPAIVVDYRSAKPRQDSDGDVEGALTVRIIAVVDDTDLGWAMRLAGIYEVAMQACLVNTLHEYSAFVRDIAPLGSDVDKRDPSGAVADVYMQVKAGPMFSRNGYLEAPPTDPPPGPDDQGEQVVITNVDLHVEANPAGGAGDGNTQ